MVKLWARTVKDNKTIKSHDYVRDVNMEWADFFDHVRELCHEMDLPTPLSLKRIFLTTQSLTTFVF